MSAAAIRKPATGRIPFFTLLLGLGMMLYACSETSPPPPAIPEDRIGEGAIYVFDSDPQEYLAAPQPFPLDPQTPPDQALALLGEHLSRTYFNRDLASEPPIRFEVLDVHRFPVPYRDYRLAVVDMIDPQMEALRIFFQGSAGGQTTFYMMGATFLQPQMDPPLADGLILLYNGKAFPEIDHVHFRGIVTPEAVRPVVHKALFRYRRQSPDAAG